MVAAEQSDAQWRGTASVSSRGVECHRPTVPSTARSASSTAEPRAPAKPPPAVDMITDSRSMAGRTVGRDAEPRSGPARLVTHIQRGTHHPDTSSAEAEPIPSCQPTWPCWSRSPWKAPHRRNQIDRSSATPVTNVTAPMRIHGGLFVMKLCGTNREPTPCNIHTAPETERSAPTTIPAIRINPA